MLDFPGESLALQGVRGPLRLSDVLLAARKCNRFAPTQVLRADRVLGADHLRSAAQHAERALNEGRNHADRLEVEFTRYSSGERQIRKALDKMGVPDGHPTGVICAMGAKRADAIAYMVDFLGLIEDDALIDSSPEKVADFGFSLAQIDATDPALVDDLALEAVAAVDLMRK